MSRDREPLLAVVAASWPPQVSGSAILLSNLLSEYPGKVTVIAGHNEYSKSDPAFQPPCPTVRLMLGKAVRLYPRVYGALKRRCPEAVSFVLRHSLYRELKQLGAGAVLAAFPYDTYVVAAFHAARRLGVPFYVHMHDLWLENRAAETAEGRFAARWEPIILRQAERVLCMTEAMQRHYKKKYGIRTDHLPHCISEKDFLGSPSRIQAPQLDKPTALFVGAVSHEMNLDALQVLANASELLPPEYEMRFCTASDLATLNRKGITSSRLRVEFLSRTEVQQLQARAHVLIAPLSHRNCAVDEVRTVFSTKLLEYLISGRPIIVFGPEDSYHVESARAHGWGFPVIHNSPAELARAIERVTRDQDLAAELVQGALQEARRRRAQWHAKRLLEWVTTDADRTH
jgi:glycosyltransferase involved in cell wall biosynthesis